MVLFSLNPVLSVQPGFSLFSAVSVLPQMLSRVSGKHVLVILFCCNAALTVLCINVFQVDLGPDKFLSDRDLQAAMKLLTGLSVRHSDSDPGSICYGRS